MNDSLMPCSPVLRLLLTATLATSVVVGFIGRARADLTPVLEYRLGEDDSPNTLNGPSAEPSKAKTGGQNLTRHGSPRYVTGNSAVSSTRAIQLSNVAGSPPQFYSTEFDFEPTEPSQWGFSCWVRFDALPDPDRSPEVTILQIGDINAGSILLQTFAKNGGIKFGTHAPGIAINVGETEVQLGRWTHLAVVFDGTGRLYVDGVEEAAVGGGQNPPAGFTLGGTRFTTGSFGSAGSLTLDDVRLFEVPAGTFTPVDLGVPAATGPTVVSTTGGPLGFTLEIQDNGNSVLDPASLSLKLNGTALTPTSVTKPGNTVVEYQRPVENPLPGGVYGISISYRDTSGNAFSDARSFRVRAYTLVPPAFLATGVGGPGFLIRPHQTTEEQPNSLQWTEEQLDGQHGANLADLTGAVGGFFARDGVIDFRNESGNTANFPGDAPFTEVGIPGPTLTNEDNAALEVLTYLSFPAAGFHTLGVNSDDGFRVTTAANARDRLGVVLGAYDGDRLAADTTFPIYIPAPGAYPFRLIYENGTGAASLEWFSLLADGTKVLLNDTSTAGAIPAYRTGPQPAYVSSVAPVRGELAAPRKPTLTVKITDADTSVTAADVQIRLDTVPAARSTSTKDGVITTVVLTPPDALPAGSTNTATLTYRDSGGRTTTNAWSFVIAKQAGATELITPTAITQKAGDTLGGFPVANLINNSGFSIPPDIDTYATAAHNASGNTWVTSTSVNPNYFTAGRTPPQFVLSLGTLYELSDLVVWGYGGNNNEATDFTVEFSTDSGSTFSDGENLQTTKLLGGNGAALVFTRKHAANAVRITMTNNGGGRGFSGAGTGDRVGLGEIKFIGRAVLLVTPTAVTQKAGDTLGGFPLINLINNSGFATPPDAGTFANSAHNASGNTWVTATAANPNYFTAGKSAPQLVFTLPDTFDLSHLVVWGYGGNNNEASDFTVEFSNDGGATFTGEEKVQTAKLLGGNSASLAFAQKHAANAARVTMTNNGGGRGFAGAGTGDRVGLGEIKFLATAVETPPQPSLSIARTGAGLDLTWPESFAGFVLEATDRLPATAWTAVPGVANNRVVVTPGSTPQFYRLRKP